MFYIIQNRLFAENEWPLLIRAIESFNLEYEIVDIDNEDILFKTKRKDVFCFGAMKMARLAKKYNWNPGCIMTPNHDFEIYSKKYQQNLVNFDSLIYRFNDDFSFEGKKFIRPTNDSKFFDAKVFSLDEWNSFKQKKSYNQNVKIQVSSIKKIEKEFRFFIVNGEVVTGSLYKMGQFVVYDSVIDNEAENFCQEMIKIFQLADVFTMDVCLINNKWKILECGCINCAGLYKANIQKLIYKIENFYSKK